MKDRDQLRMIALIMSTCWVFFRNASTGISIISAKSACRERFCLVRFDNCFVLVRVHQSFDSLHGRCCNQMPKLIATCWFMTGSHFVAFGQLSSEALVTQCFVSFPMTYARLIVYDHLWQLGLVSFNPSCNRSRVDRCFQALYSVYHTRGT